MKLLWVTSEKIGSRLVRWGTDADCSHFAISFDEDERGRGIVFHSYGSGTQLLWFREFLKGYEIVHALAPKQNLTIFEEEYVYKNILDQESGLKYDYPALTWWAWQVLMSKVFGRPVTHRNRYENPKMRLCTGIAPAVLNALQIDFPKDIDPEITPPHELYHLFRDSGEFVVCNDWVEKMNCLRK